ncbi:MAG: NHL repeat-containing protein [bacterium]
MKKNIEHIGYMITILTTAILSLISLAVFPALDALAQPPPATSADTVAVGRKVRCLGTIYSVDEQGKPNLKDGLPKGIALDEAGKLFAVFLDRTEVQVFNAQGKFLYRFGKKGTGPGAFVLPMSIEVAGNGTVLVLDPELKKVLAFSNKGEFQSEFSFAESKGPHDKEPVRCTKMGLDRRNDVLYLSDSANANIKLFNLKGDFLGLFPLDRAKAVAAPGKTSFDSQGRIYIIDSINGWVQVYSSQKKLLLSFGELGARLGNLARPVAVSVNSQGNIYVLDRLLSVIQIFDPSGRVIDLIKDTDVPDGLNSAEPFDMVMDAQGTIYVSLQGPHCIKVLKDSGERRR